MLYSIKMRASRMKKDHSEHISGAERILALDELKKNTSALLDRALSHAKGQPDFINIKIEAASAKDIIYIDALPVSTIEVADEKCGQEAIGDLLEKLDIKNIRAIMELFKQTYGMRGAMLLDVDTLERLEPNHERGIRATYMDAVHDNARTATGTKNHFQEAIVLASKVVNAPGIIAELCMSDDPDYVTGYVAAPTIGYVRITKLKPMGCPDGGRIFLYRGTKENVASCINYLEKQKVLVRNVPSSPDVEIKTEKQIMDPWKSIRDDLAKRHQADLYRTMQIISSPQCAHVTVDNRDMLLLASNSYLGLIDDERVKVAAKRAIDKYGVGSGGSRLTTGDLPLHEQLESDLAAFKGTEAALLFNTGYMANVGIISALGKRGSVIFSDELNHASIIDGCRLSHAQTVVYRHNDMADLAMKIKETAPSCGLIVSDGVFSMDGDIADLPSLMALARKNGLLTMIDEAHATGVIGKAGHGIVEHFGLEEIPDVLMGTLSKSLASEGGFVCGSKLLIDYLKNTARSFVFSTSLAPATLAAAGAALDILKSEPQRVAKLQQNTQIFCAALKDAGIEVASESAIVPIIIGDEGHTVRLANRLKADGIYLSAIRYPTVAKGSARLRAAIMATHTEDELIWAAKKIADAINS